MNKFNGIFAIRLVYGLFWAVAKGLVCLCTILFISFLFVWIGIFGKKVISEKVWVGGQQSSAHFPSLGTIWLRRVKDILRDKNDKA